MQLSWKWKTFSNFLFQFWNLHQILNLLKHKMIVIANAFPKLQTVKDLLRPLSKKWRFRTPFDRQHNKGFQTLVKSAWEHFHHIFSSLWGKLIWKISPLVICEILGVFVNKLTSILFGIVRICQSRFKWNYLKNDEPFLYFLFHFWNLHQILNLLKHKMIVIANAFPKLQTVKDLLRPLSKKWRFRTPFDRQHNKGFQTLVKSAWEHFHHIFSSLWGKLIWKISPLVICEILGVFVNKLTSILFGIVRICQSRFKWNYLKNDEPFLYFLFHFWNLHQILNLLKKKMIVIANVFPKLQTESLG